MRRSRSPLEKHKNCDLYVVPSNSPYHKFVMRCATHNGKYVKWATALEYEAYMSLQKDKKSSDAI